MIKVEIISTIPILDNARGKKILAESKSKVSNDDSSGLPFRNKNSSIHRLYTAENLECHENPLSFPNLSKKEKNSPPRKKKLFQEKSRIENSAKDRYKKKKSYAIRTQNTLLPHFQSYTHFYETIDTIIHVLVIPVPSAKGSKMEGKWQYS